MSSSIPSAGTSRTGRAVVPASPATLALRDLLTSYGEVQRHVAGELGLGLNDVAALEHLIRRGEVGPAGLATLLGITTASATVLVDRLERAGHVERRTHVHDRRRKQLVVTDHAQGEVFATLQPVLDIHQEIDQHYSDEELAIIESYLRRVARKYHEHVHGPASNDDHDPDSPVGRE